MTHDQHLVTPGWADYELLDSGDGAKLERFGGVTLARPETQALWAKREPARWGEAHAVFSAGEKGGAWERVKEMPESWDVAYGPLRFVARLSSFKHVGIFPEQSPNWVWIKDGVKALGARQEAARKQSGLPGEARTGDPRTFSQQPPDAHPHILNLFGYTGIATLAAAHAGAKVTHVDASKQSLTWASENARATGLAEDAVRWIADDALAFAKREARRDARYDGIILDPPAFGRGAKGEVWHIERDLPALLALCHEILAEAPGAFFLVNGYAAGYASRAFAQAVESAFGGLSGVALAESGELHIKENDSDRVVPAGIYCRFVR
ncbi:MAG: class I SAM-dependent methyltransferase [Patescibacteria group bacterium]|nr:class I SAM-dependent methyltransferase [Patescibacteria group bacterium]MDE1944340.1 class I SAM-dependent methyltransferase [Patescibacteria group bacterium]MDE1945334.1 class I SAM-dependent methyltransferase [Patescibacteria group bacterium]MDE2057690.1 class I SAM-dependent methyltransferase [Patescibacteria group bacterium]